VRRLESTTLLLGALGDDGFESHDEPLALQPGDTLFMVTDGLFEARDRRGEQFGLQRLQASLSRTEAPSDWAAHLIELVQGWRNRMADDDLLVTTIRWNGAPNPASRQPASPRLTAGAGT
jgi:serine phosphatase RsbU (regulator of sigma subunit)